MPACLNDLLYSDAHFLDSGVQETGYLPSCFRFQGTWPSKGGSPVVESR